MRFPSLNLSSLDPRNLFRRRRGNEPTPAAGPRFPVNAGREGARPRGEASLRIPDNRLPVAVPAEPIDIPAANGTQGRVRFDAGQAEGHDHVPNSAPRTSGRAMEPSRSASPPPGYDDSPGEDANSITGSPPNPFRSDSPAPSYIGGRLRDDEQRLGEDGEPWPQSLEGGPLRSGLATPSTLELEGRPGAVIYETDGRHPLSRVSFAGSAGSLDSAELDALLDRMPPLSRFPTPPPRD